MPQSRTAVRETADQARHWLAVNSSEADDDLRRLALAVIESSRIDVEIAAAVEAARDNGRPWTEIAGILGVTRQAARTRFGMLRVLFGDAQRGVGRWMDVPGSDHGSPPELLDLPTTVDEGDGPRPGTYRLSGEKRDGRWLYRPDF